MGNRVITGIFVALTIYILLINKNNVMAAASSSSNIDQTHHVRNRPIVRVINRPFNQYSRIKPEMFGDFLDDDDLLEFSKRQMSDDYGHLRFGKRGEELFDDYGHMRFGRSDN